MLLLHAAQLISLSWASWHDHRPHAGSHLHNGDILDEPSLTLKMVSKAHCRVTDHTSLPGPVVPRSDPSVLTLTSFIHWMRTDRSSVCLLCGVRGVGGRKWILKNKEYEMLVLYNSHKIFYPNNFQGI